MTETFTSLRTMLFTISESMGLVELPIILEFKWNNMVKSISSWVNQDKNNSSFTNQPKNTSTFTNQPKL